MDALGAPVIAILGHGYLRTAGNASFLEGWIGSFIEEDPPMFRR